MPGMAAETHTVEMPTMNRPGKPSLPYGAVDLDDDDWGDRGDYSDLLARQRTTTGWRYLLYGGGLGHFLLSTNLGRGTLILAIGLWLTYWEFALTIVNRTIIWCIYLKGNYTSYTRFLYMILGIHYFPYPLTTIFLQLVISHFFILLVACTTRYARLRLECAGLRALVAPSARVTGDRPQTQPGRLERLASGIAGGGLFEFDLPTAVHILPVAITHVVMMWLSTLLFTYSYFSSYQLARIGTAPIALLLSSFIGGANHQKPLFVTVIAATVFLAIAMQIKKPFIWSNVPAGIMSSIFTVLYPMLITKTFKELSLPSTRQRYTAVSPQMESSEPAKGGEDSRTYWQFYHYTSLLSIITFMPLVVLSGEIPNFWRDRHDLDSFFYGLMLVLGGLIRGTIFLSTILMTRITSPLTVTFWTMFPASLSLAIMMAKRLFMENWVALAMYWMSCGWFILWKLEEGNMG